jgi:hypothetical protein
MYAIYTLNDYNMYSFTSKIGKKIGNYFIINQKYLV